MTRRRFVGTLCAAALVAAGSAAAVVVTRDGGAAAGDDPVLVAPPTTAAPATTARATTTLPPLPVPEPPPADPYEDVPVVPVGTISIPAIGLTHTVYEGVWLTVINVGPGHWPGSARPGERGNTVFAGHRTTYSRPFHDLDRLVPGDQVLFDVGDRTEVYAVRETIVVEPTDLWVVDQTQARTFTLIACHPKGSAAQRIVVKGDHVATVPKP